MNVSTHNQEPKTELTDATQHNNVPLLSLDKAKALLQTTTLKNLNDTELTELLESIRQFCIISYYHTAYDSHEAPPVERAKAHPKKAKKSE